MSDVVDVAPRDDQGAASIAAAARVHALDRKERGSFSFLTWPFFLAQVLALDPFIAGAAKSAPVDDDASHQAPAADPGQEASPPVVAATGELNGGDDEPVQSVSASSTGELAISLPVIASDFQPAQRDVPFLNSDTGDSVAPVAVSGGGGSGTGSAIRSAGSGASSHGEVIVHLAAPAAPSSAGGSDASLIPGADSIVPPLVGMEHGPAMGPVGSLPEIASHPGDALAGAVPAAAAPVGAVVDALPPLLDTAIHAIDGLLLPVASVVDAVPGELHTVANAVGALAGDVLAPVASVVDASMQPITAGASGAVGAVEQVLAPVAAEVEPAAAIVSTVQIVADGLGMAASPLGADEPIASGGSIAFGGEPALDLPMLDPFVDGRYTDYGMALAQAPQPGLALPSLGEGDQVASADPHHPASADPAAASVSDPDGHPATAALAPAEPSPILDEVALRLHDSVL